MMEGCQQILVGAKTIRFDKIPTRTKVPTKCRVYLLKVGARETAMVSIELPNPAVHTDAAR